METRKRPPAFPIAIILVIAYLSLFPNPAARELVVRVAWSTALEGAVGGAEGEAFPFHVGGQYGYVDSAGKLESLEPVFYDVTLNGEAYVNYAKGGGTMVVRLRGGQIAGTLPGTAWPVIPDTTRDTVYLFTTDLLSVAEASLSGRTRWSRELGSVITCFAPVAAGNTRAVLGTLDGVLHILGAQGQEIVALETTGSRLAGTYGCTATPDGRLVAAIQGIDPQRLSVLVPTEGGYRVLWTRPHAPETRTEVVLRFTADGRYLVADAGDGFVVHEVRGGQSVRVPAAGSLESAVSVGREVVLLTRATGGTGALLVLSPPGVVAAQVSLPDPRDEGEVRHLSGHEGFFLYGAGDRLSRLDVLRL